MTREEHLAFCRREIAECIAAQTSAPNPEEQLGAFQGEMDWRAMESILMEEGGQESME